MKLRILQGLIIAMAGISACDNLTPTQGAQSKSGADTEISEPKNWRAPEHTAEAYTSITANASCIKESDEIRYVDPLPYIIQRAKQNKIIMINEAHYKPLHRAFIAKLAEEIKPLGFDVYGAETLSHQGNSKLLSRKYPLIEDGAYTREPIFGQAIEQIINAGYDVFAYEATFDPMQNTLGYREAEQAKNIFKKMKAQPESKMLIHAGYHHVLETEDSQGKRWMAKIFKEISGVDPLTIGQTECFSETAFEGGIFGYALPIKKDGTPVSYRGYDITLIPPKEGYQALRPNWMQALGRTLISPPPELIFDDRYTLIRAHNTARNPNAVVEDEIYRAPFSEKKLSLRPGAYRVETLDSTKQIIATKNLTIK